MRTPSVPLRGSKTPGLTGKDARKLAAAELKRAQRAGWQPGQAASGKPSRLELVRAALNEDNRLLWADNPAGARTKFEKLRTSPFVFFRGTAGLFYRDLAALHLDKARVLVAGDVHPENFGAVKRANGKVAFDLNDFDEATHAPFTHDLLRGVTAFELAARERGFSNQKRSEVNEAFLRGYRDAIRQFADGKKEHKTFLTREQATGVVKKLLEKGEKAKRVDFLEERVDLDTRRFLATEEIKPQSERLEEFKTALATWAKGRALGGQPLDLRDVALKLDSGTASLGSQRYYVLLAHPKGPKRDVIVEVKQEGPSVLEPFVGKDPRPAAERVVDAQQRLSPGGDPYYGAVWLQGESFVIRERQPEKTGVDLGKLDPSELAAYARACGAVLAAAHARSDRIDGKSAERVIKKQLDGALVKEALAFAQSAADRVVTDHARFTRMWKSGRFEPGLSSQLA